MNSQTESPTSVLDEDPPPFGFRPAKLPGVVRPDSLQLYKYNSLPDNQQSETQQASSVCSKPARSSTREKEAQSTDACTKKL